MRHRIVPTAIPLAAVLALAPLPVRGQAERSEVNPVGRMKKGQPHHGHPWWGYVLQEHRRRAAPALEWP